MDNLLFPVHFEKYILVHLKFETKQYQNIKKLFSCNKLSINCKFLTIYCERDICILKTSSISMQSLRNKKTLLLTRSLPCWYCCKTVQGSRRLDITVSIFKFYIIHSNISYKTRSSDSFNNNLKKMNELWYHNNNKIRNYSPV